MRVEKSLLKMSTEEGFLTVYCDTVTNYDLTR